MTECLNSALTAPAAFVYITVAVCITVIVVALIVAAARAD